MQTARRPAPPLVPVLLVVVGGLVTLALFLWAGLARSQAEATGLRARLTELEKQPGTRPESWEEAQRSPEILARVEEMVSSMAAVRVAGDWSQFDPEKAVGLWLNARGWAQRRQLATPELRETLPGDDAWVGRLFQYRQDGKPEWTGDLEIVALEDHAWRTGDRTTVRVRLPFAPRNNRKAVAYVQEISFDMVYTLVYGWRMRDVKRSQPDPGMGP